MVSTVCHPPVGVKPFALFDDQQTGASASAAETALDSSSAVIRQRVRPCRSAPYPAKPRARRDRPAYAKRSYRPLRSAPGDQATAARSDPFVVAPAGLPRAEGTDGADQGGDRSAPAEVSAAFPMAGWKSLIVDGVISPAPEVLVCRRSSSTSASPAPRIPGCHHHARLLLDRPDERSASTDFAVIAVEFHTASPASGDTDNATRDRIRDDRDRTA